MSKILFLVNHDVVIYNFRLELVQKLLAEGHHVIISSPYGERIEFLKQLGCEYHEINISRHGMNPYKELKLLCTYKRLLRNVRPDVVLTYTIKPNIYGGIACQSLHIPYIANITGLGMAIENQGFMQKVISFLYRKGLKRAQKVFFQNTANQNYMVEHKIVQSDYDLLPGSGVNLQQHCPEPYPSEQEPIVFLTIGRIMRDKGTDEVLYAARAIKKEYPHVIFKMLGIYDGDYQEKIENAVAEGVIEYLGQQLDVHSFIKNSHATIHASYHEGMANVLLESAACGRPVIATDIPGCRETFDSDVSGISCKVRDAEDLVCAIRKFIEMPYTDKVKMGCAGRKKVEVEFDRTIIVDKYLDEINKISKK